MIKNVLSFIQSNPLTILLGFYLYILYLIFYLYLFYIFIYIYCLIEGSSLYRTVNRRTLAGASQGCAHAPSRAPPHPTLQVVAEPWLELPVMQQTPLALHFTYGNVCFHGTLSIHPTLSFLPPPATSSSLFSISVSPRCPANNYISTIFLDSILCAIVNKICFSDLLYSV